MLKKKKSLYRLPGGGSKLNFLVKKKKFLILLIDVKKLELN